MPLFWKPYTSDTTAFIAEMRKQKPSLEEEQRRGRGLLWDKRQDPELANDFLSARVRQRPYVYQTDVDTQLDTNADKVGAEGGTTKADVK